MAAWGLSEDDYPAEELRIWPDNWQAVSQFTCLGTQWRMGMAGPVGIDYNVLPSVFTLNGIPETEWPELFQSIRVMESAALAMLHQKE
jgi:hypothetical protein